MLIGALQKSSLIEFPGRISTIIFTQGCNLRCPYCHNPELVDPGRFGPPLDMEEVFSFLAKRKGMLDGVVITGGEPCLQQDLLDVLARIQALGYAIKLDSNGTQPDMLENAIAQGLVDYIAMDIKAPAAFYAKVAGAPVDTAAIQRSIALIMTSGLDYEFRTTLARSLLTTEDVLSLCMEIRGAKRYALQNFVSSKHVDETFLHAQAFSTAELEIIREALQDSVQELIIR